MDKKGSYELGYKMMFWAVFIFFIAGLFLVFGQIIYSYKSQAVHVPAQFQADLIALRFSNNPDCFAYQDKDVQRVYPGSIDVAKFNQESMDRCYKTDKDRGIKEFNFRLKLQEMGTEVHSNNYYNNERDDLTIFREIIVHDGEKDTKDTLIIYVQEKI